jgi:uncharacterized protein with LGFP repeats/GH25 family lysozyme M1 (1,4-beta-N-acetylmuramidase)
VGTGRTALATVPQVYGMDVSNYQGNVNWAAAKNAGGAFVYIKATESTTFQNPNFAQQYNGSAAVGIIRGAYHFALPDRSSGATQANYFLAHGGGWSPDGITMPPMLDMEYNPYGSNTCYGLSPSQMVSWVNDFSNTVHARTGRYPVIYTSTYWWNQCTGSNASFGSKNPLFIARYASTPGGMPAGWGFQSIWQYSDHGTFPGDQDVFNGSLAQLKTFAGVAQGSATKPPVSTPPPAAPIDAYYAKLGSAYVGTPTDAEYAIAGGRARDYTNGTIYYSAATGAHLVRGGILVHYRQLGGPAGILGFPTTDEKATPDTIGRYNHFAGAGGSSIYWTPTTGSHETQGAIQAHWAALGWERGPLGYPTTDEKGSPDHVGRYNHFSGSGGSAIYWSPATGAHETQGAIQAHWASLGWEMGFLGYPTTDEAATAGPGGRYNAFAHGVILWSPTSGAHEVHGAIHARWVSLGFEKGRLGFPISDEYSVAGGRRSNFQGGSITWIAATGATVVTYS